MMGDEKYVDIPFDTLWELEKDCFMGMGLTEEEAKICADVLFEADRRGIDSHGVGRLFMYYARLRRKQQSATTNITVERDKGAIARLAADNGMGQVVSHKAMQMAIDKAKQFGIGMVTVGNSNHYGIAGYYTLMASKQGCIGISGTNARPSIAPTWGVEPMLGTNPLTISFPTDYEPTGGHWFADHATSITQRGKIEWYARLNKPGVKGWVINAAGEDPTDTKQILKDMLEKQAALNPLGGSGEELGGYKGYNYATFVEVLSAALSSANYLQNCLGFKNVDGKRVFEPYRLGHFFIAIDIDAFTELEEFRRITGDILRTCAGARRMPGADHIFVAGEKEYTIELERAEKGVPISEATQLQMLQMIDEMKLDDKKYNVPWTVEYSGVVDSQGW